ncbi:hypothetical protein [Archangium sp.]|uniref:hypothetical protein n=1 Tax=Archangium sp. TaxID=1872627 RepID=UPI002D69DA1D|nr:hypothetical protein [Archangium sp.]HYO51950.1 hypothetical protein [Archangium sp.]
MTRYLFLALTVLVGLPGLGWAQAVTPYNPRIAGVPVSCLSSQGEPVAFVPNSSLADVGLWFPSWPGVPAHVEYNPGLLARLPPWVQLFWFGHACAHGALAAGLGEESADCWSVQFLKRRGLVSRAQVVELQSYLMSAPVVPWGHRPGPARARLLPECYDRVSALPWETQGVVSQSGVPVGASAGEEYPGVKRWRFCSHIPGVSVPTSSGHVSKGSCEKERGRLQEGDTDYVVTECVLTSSERCSAPPR